MVYFIQPQQIATIFKFDEILIIIILERDGRDLCCVISSLAQLMIDSHFRSIVGLQTLIQKEWVVMGHQFCTRLGHVNTNSVKVEYIFHKFINFIKKIVMLKYFK